MPALSYSKENIEKYDFENKIIKGIKKHTIRRNRSRPFKIGDTLYHYKNWRTPQVFKFHENKCLYIADFLFEDMGNKKGKITINNKIISGWGFFELARNDGFNCFQDFKHFFIKAGLPFYGQIIGWVKGIEYE